MEMVKQVRNVMHAGWGDFECSWARQECVGGGGGKNVGGRHGGRYDGESGGQCNACMQNDK